MALLFAYGQSSRGVATPIRDTPRDVLSVRKSNGSSKFEFRAKNKFLPRVPGQAERREVGVGVQLPHRKHGEQVVLQPERPEIDQSDEGVVVDVDEVVVLQVQLPQVRQGSELVAPDLPDHVVLLQGSKFEFPAQKSFETPSKKFEFPAQKVENSNHKI